VADVERTVSVRQGRGDEQLAGACAGGVGAHECFDLVKQKQDFISAALPTCQPLK
jgi:hypothetical protein